jgi:DNA-binding CsgD family transcriptional regulator
MAIIIPKNHISLSSENDIRTICASLFAKFGIDFFYYARVFDDNSCYILSSHSSVVNYLFEREYRVIALTPPERVRKKFCYFRPVTGPYQQFLHDFRDFFKLTYPIDFFEQHDGYVEIFCFAMELNAKDIINSYFNNFDQLEKFILYFKEKIISLHKDLGRQAIVLPEHMGTNFNSQGVVFEYDPITQQKCLKLEKNKTHYLTINNQRVSFTSREMDCLNKLVIGYSAKEIAKSLSLSHRTVEFYLQNVKAKVGYHKKSELIKMVLNQNRKFL